MSLQSFGFFGFLLVVAAVYLNLPKRWQSAFLQAASWVFYALAMPSMLPVTIAIAVFTYLCGRGMTAREGARKTAFLRIGVVGLLAILAFFKYNGAFASDGGWQAVAMPLGISFYTFQTLSYSIDVYRRDVKAERNIIDFGAYVVMFPQLIAGPIVKYRDVSDQLHVYKHRYNLKQIEEGMTLFTFGLAKKVLLAVAVGARVTDIIG